MDDYTIFDFINAYSTLYKVEEDDFTKEDVVYIEDTWWNYCETANLPGYMRIHLCTSEV